LKNIILGADRATLKKFQRKYENGEVIFKLPPDYSEVDIEEAREYLHSDEVRDIVGNCPIVFFEYVTTPFAKVEPEIRMSYHYLLAADGKLTGNLQDDRDSLLLTLAHEQAHKSGLKFNFHFLAPELQKFLYYCDEVRADLIAFQKLSAIRGGLTPGHMDRLLAIRERYDPIPDADGKTHPSRVFRSEMVRQGRFDEATIDAVAEHMEYRVADNIEKVKKRFSGDFFSDLNIVPRQKVIKAKHRGR